MRGSAIWHRFISRISSPKSLSTAGRWIFNRELPAVQEPRDMHLADGSGRERLRLEVIEQFGGPFPELLQEDSLHIGVGEGSHSIQEIKKCIAVFERKNIRLQR